MKFNADTLRVLQNFAAINSSLLFQEGNVLKTMADSKSVFARAEVTNKFPSDFAIYDLNKLLGVLSLFENPEVEIMEKYLKIVDGKKTVKYQFAALELITPPPKKEIRLPEVVDAEFELKSDVFETVSKAMKVLKLPDVAFTGDGEKIFVKAVDPEQATQDEYKVEIGETSQKFNMVFKWDNLNKIIPGDYQVKITSKGISQFSTEGFDYFIAVQAKSSDFES